MKRILALLLVFSILFLSSCVNKDNDKDSSKSSENNALEQIETNIGKKPYSKDIFKDYELTLVNVWATWCPPCVAEIPHLGELANELEAKNVNIIGILFDAVDSKTGKTDSSVIEKADTILSSSNAEYAIFLPDADLFSGLLKDVRSLPTTFFINKDGEIVGSPVVGAKDKAAWEREIDKYLELL